ncbi:MAG: AAA family ATPase, partial [Armatimonadetes bacterium]|nr:AAA family ATPase [Armatimonadota bacterium]
MTAMYEWLEIKGFRGIRELRIEGLRRVNVFVGENGTGKSTVLEAVAMVCSGANAEMPLILNQTRGVPLVAESHSIAALFREPGWGEDAPPVFSVAAGPMEDGERVLLSVGGVRQFGPTLGDRVAVVSSAATLLGLKAALHLPGRKNEGHQWVREGEHKPPGSVARTHMHYHIGRGIVSGWLARLLASASDSRQKPRLIDFLRRQRADLADLESRPVGDGTSVFAVFDEAPALPIEVMGDGL